MPGLEVRAATPDDFEAVRALNFAALAYTSAMDPDRLIALDALSCYHNVACVDGEVAAFVLAMRRGAPYENENFAWFGRRYPDFIYIDRIVVSPAHRGAKLGSLLYADLFRHAREHGVALLACEYNISPPNEPSRRFHDRFGFREAGTQWVSQGTKRVSLQVAET
jgi:predicted GNAT superfamily acetyltransferase